MQRETEASHTSRAEHSEAREGFDDSGTVVTPENTGSVPWPILLEGGDVAGETAWAVDAPMTAVVPRGTFPQPFPLPHGGPELALIAAAIAAVRRRRGAVVDVTGRHVQHGGRHHARFGRLAYALTCATIRDEDGFCWETIPANVGGRLVGCWRPGRVGRILHLCRFHVIDGVFVLGPRWKTIWLLCAWHAPAEVGARRARPARTLRRAPRARRASRGAKRWTGIVFGRALRRRAHGGNCFAIRGHADMNRHEGGEGG